MSSPLSTSDPLISHGWHFGRTVFALCNYPSLLMNSLLLSRYNGILRLEQMEDTPLEDLSADERWEHHVFEQLLDSYPGLLERLQNRSEEEILHIGELIGKGAAGARGDDTKTLKSAILDWIAPKGAAIQPPLHRNSKIDRRFNHELTGSLLCPAGMNWNDSDLWGSMAHLLYAHYTYDVDDPWCGLLRSRLLVCAYKHIFTSPSSVNKEPKATSVTIASMAYIATQVQFTLSSSSTFYHSLLDLFEDPNESTEVDELLTWWNCQVFPNSSAAKRPISANSVLSKIWLKRLAAKQATDSNSS
ncbi:uncharacterized protein HD556DRAFT_1432645 [Suillus plorans]|uniref:Uncharacterized protein n=1 Tax=Suillus plorans TaxID=116603 RepID=A0A9P7ALZ5_9AGAM|nr:uncharacterized protein HD556DRAFT_1432645 [Suillus plorans]KAG1792276.1 hypothetical protein HD556DRAFT_1432645 [Suillus plorans]